MTSQLRAIEAATSTVSESKTIALVGNPNTGKTTLFNRLTGTRQKVGNYPGVTVERKSGRLPLGDQSASVIDLPGTYSLSAHSIDESIVVESLTGHLGEHERPDLIVCVLDATNLSRNLYLASQLADLDTPIVCALNMIDAAEKAGITIDAAQLSKHLGVPVIPIAASRGFGMTELKTAIQESLRERCSMIRVPWPTEVRAALEQLRQSLPATEGEPTLSDAQVMRLLFDHESILLDRISLSKTNALSAIASARASLRDVGINPLQVEPTIRYQAIQSLLDGVITQDLQRPLSFTEKVDRVLTHRVFGLFIFLGLMYGVFQSIYTLAAPFMELIDTSFGNLSELVGPHLEKTPVLQSLIADGIIPGVGGVLIFLPQILILFLFIALLEDTGYMARAAYLMDKVFGWCGLSGKSFVPLLSSYACAVPGIMATRTIEDSKSRLATILVAPLMSCSARLPVYVLLIGAFIEPTYGPTWAGAALFGMHFVGLLVAIPAALVINRWILKGRPVPFVLELPNYRLPHVQDVLWQMYLKGKDFVVQAGTIILAMSIVIWALCYFPRDPAIEQRVRSSMKQELLASHVSATAEAEALLAGELSATLERRTAGAQLENSYMGRLGKLVEPIFRPAGFDWKITVGILASFPAREVIISTLGIIYNLGGDVDEESKSLVRSMKNSERPDGSAVFTPLVAVSVMVFFALCLQCGATVASIARESNWKWSVFAFTYMSVLAWGAAVLIYQTGSALALGT